MVRQAAEELQIETRLQPIVKLHLAQPNALLMTIGYSFSDEHINDAICEAQEANEEFGLYVVDPSWAGGARIG